MLVHQPRDGAVLSPCKNILFIRAANNISAIVRHHSLFIDIIRHALNYPQIFELEYGVPFIWARISAIVSNMSASDFLCAMSDSTYMGYPCVAKLFIKCSDIYRLGRAQSDCSSASDNAVLVSHILMTKRSLSQMMMARYYLFRHPTFILNNPSRTSAFSLNPFTFLSVDCSVFFINCATASTRTAGEKAKNIVIQRISGL